MEDVVIVHVTNSGDDLTEDVNNVLFLHPDSFLGQALRQIPPVSILHLYHEDAIPLEAVVVRDNVGVIQGCQYPDLI